MNEKNNLSMFNFTTLWFGAAISVAEILAGGLLAPLGFKFGLIAILIGHLVGTTALVLGGVIGTEKRLPALESTRISFGRCGSYIFSILNVLQLLGWTTIMIISGARSLNQLTKNLWSFDNITLWSVVIGAFILLWVWLGKDSGWRKVNHIAVILLFGLTVVLSVVVFRSGDLFTNTIAGEMSFGGALELAVVMPLSWLPLISDYTRYAKEKKSGAWGSWIGYFVGSSWMYIIGLGTAIVSNDPDPSGVLLAVNLGTVAIGIILLATVTTTFLDAFSAGVSFTNIFPKLNAKTVALVITALGTLLALVVDLENYQNFLYMIGSVFAPLFAVLLTDYFLFKNKEVDARVVINWSSLIICAIGTALYYQFIKLDLVVGATIPVMIITAVIFAVTRKVMLSWKLIR